MCLSLCICMIVFFTVVPRLSTHSYKYALHLSTHAKCMFKVNCFSSEYWRCHSCDNTRTFARKYFIFRDSGILQLFILLITVLRMYFKYGIKQFSPMISCKKSWDFSIITFLNYLPLNI